MLTQLVVENFKAFSEPQQVRLAPITLVFGGNSAGKSSLIQALLLMRQSLVPEGPFPSSMQSADLVVRGGFTDLGSHRALVHAHDMNRRVTLGVSAEPDRRHTTHPGRRGSSTNMSVDPTGVAIVEWVYGRAQRDQTAGLDHVETRLRLGSELVTIPAGRENAALARRLSTARPGGISILDALATRQLLQWVNASVDVDLLSALNDLPREARAVVRLAAGAPVELLGFEHQLGPQPTESPDDELVESPAIEGLRRRGRDEFAVDVVNDWFQTGPGSVRIALRAINYLGPMRAAPERLNILSGERVLDTGNSGEHVVALLARSSHLLRDVNEWFGRLEIPYSADIRTVTDDAVAGAIGEVHCLLLRDERSGIEVAPTDVGFGIGQVLPVVVQSILRRGQTLCIEQPEIHLHPALQARLAELFAAEVTAPLRGPRRSQFILETHSEHLILRLQRLVRTGTLEPQDLSVLHVGHNSEGVSVVRELRLDAAGEFVDQWPGGFFEERLTELFDL